MNLNDKSSIAFPTTDRSKESKSELKKKDMLKRVRFAQENENVKKLHDNEMDDHAI